MHTSALQSAPNAIACTKPSPVFVAAIFSAVSPTLPFPNSATSAAGFRGLTEAARQAEAHTCRMAASTEGQTIDDLVRELEAVAREQGGRGVTRLRVRIGPP